MVPDMSLFIAISAAVFTLFASAQTTASENAAVRYRPWVGDDVIEIRHPTPGSKGQIVIAGHAFYAAEFCDEKSPYCCVKSRALTFAIPRDLDANQRTWVVLGTEFRVTDRDVSLSLLGRRFEDLIAIKANFSDDKPEWTTEFLYSPSLGLVGFQTVTRNFENVRRPFWLEKPNGFCAP